MGVAAIAIMIGVVSLMFIVFMIVWGVRKSRSSTSESQRLLSDRALLLLINAEADRIISPAQLAKKSGISLGQARSRLHRMMYDGLVNQMTSGFKYFYELKKPIEDETVLKLSDKPFISINTFSFYQYIMKPRFNMQA